jgi:drug/metabolite transporter (DMT)-like permease
MTRRNLAELVLLASIWGASFLLMRLGAVDFGPVALAFVRVAGASLLLLPMLAWRGQGGALRQHWRPIAVIGLVNSALPFVLFTVAALVLNAGLSAVFNATSPLWTAVVARLWLGERLTPMRWFGLALGFAGVLGLVAGKASLQPGEHGVSPALGIAACLAAAVLYGFAANYTRKTLAGVPPMAVAAGSQAAATLWLFPAAIWFWPAANPGSAAWAMAAALAVFCTGAAYVLYFRLIASAGPSNAITVTFLVPVFAMLWGALFIGESPTVTMLAGCAVILLGTGLATGLLRRPGR